LKLRFGEKQKLNILRAIELVSGSEHGIFDVPHKDIRVGGLPEESPKELEQTRFDINRLFGRPYREVINTLLKIKGVGRKIADCVALFSLEKLEAVPLELARKITESLSIPTIGIGAGPHCDGQVLVFHDVLGIFQEFKPKFVKRYANLRDEIVKAVSRYAEEVRSGVFPDEEHSYR